MSAEPVIARLGHFAPTLRAVRGGLTISGGEVLVQAGFIGRILRAAKAMSLHTAIETSGALGMRVTDEHLQPLDLVILDLKSGDLETYHRVTKHDLAPTLRFAERHAARAARTRQAGARPVPGGRLQGALAAARALECWKPSDTFWSTPRCSPWAPSIPVI